MTREEAIKFGNMWLEMNEDCKDSSTYAFFHMAIKALKQEPCTNAISRQAAIDAAIEAVADYTGYYSSVREEYIRKALERLRPVTPAEKVGEWTTTITPLGKCCICSECGSCPPIEYRFCPYCGAKMQEVNNAGTSRGQNNNT